LAEVIDVVIEDEAHKQMGEKTKEMLKTLIKDRHNIKNSEYEKIILSLIEKKEIDDSIIEEIDEIVGDKEILSEEEVEMIKSILKDLL
jgi:uncharacterized membrane-anchored protein YjiN (DUF445 family)